jgi:hypothetical protein
MIGSPECSIRRGSSISRPILTRPKRVSAIAIDQDRIYVAGSFSRASVGATPLWEAREGGVAITAGGALTAWRPRIEARCFLGGRFPVPYSCIGQMRISAGRVFLQGSLQRLDAPGEARRSLLAVSGDTGALDSLVPFVPAGVISAIAADQATLFAVATDFQESWLARVDTAAGARLIATLGPYSIFSPPPAHLASHDARLYADVERDEASGLATGNPMPWQKPISVDGGVLDVSSDPLAAAVAWHADIAPVVPATPIGLMADSNADRVTLRWSSGTGDLQPLESPPPVGGTAAITHVLTVSLAAGGSPVAQVETGSPSTDYTVVASPGTYFVRVSARNAAGTSGPSAEVRVDVRPSVPEPPLATVAAVSAGAVRVQWQAPPRGWPATGYLIEAGSSPGAANIGVLPVSGLEFAAAGVPPGRYYLRVRAVNATGASVAGDEVVVDIR